MMEWIGVDLDGTLAHFDEWRGVEHIGEPLMPMVRRVKAWLRAGKTVKIFTARIHGRSNAKIFIDRWCRKHIGQSLPVTNIKDPEMIELWDDRARRVAHNKGTEVK